MRETVTEKEISLSYEQFLGETVTKKKKSNDSISFITLLLLTGLQQHEIILGDFQLLGGLIFGTTVCASLPKHFVQRRQK